VTDRLKITQTGSPIGRPATQRKTLIALGLNKLQRSRVVYATPSMQGQIDKVKHLLKVEPAAAEQEQQPAQGGEG
jgi:large subunit ribosomal protein L30